MFKVDLKRTPQTINNSSCVNDGNHVCGSVWISDLDLERFPQLYFSVFSLGFSFDWEYNIIISNTPDHII